MNKFLNQITFVIKLLLATYKSYRLKSVSQHMHKHTHTQNNLFEHIYKQEYIYVYIYRLY